MYLGLKKRITLRVDGVKSEKGDFVIVVSYKVDAPLSCYRNRWQIEVSSRNLKASGSHIEDSHVTDPKRLMTLCQITHFVFALCFKIGKCLEEKRPRKIKKHGYPEVTLIHYALLAIQPSMIKNLGGKKPLNIHQLLKLVGWVKKELRFRNILKRVTIFFELRKLQNK